MTSTGDIDHIAITRRIRGDHPLPELTHHEKHHAAWQLTQAGISSHQAADLIGASQRSVLRWRQKWTKGAPPMPAPYAPDTLQPADTWREHAACADLDDAETMFPAPTDTIGIEDAKKVCDTCPVLRQCRRSAIDHREQWGVWGGLSEAERRNLWRNKRPEYCGTETGWRRHKSRGEYPCAPCSTAHDRHVDAERRERLLAEHNKGGSKLGASLHSRLGEPACDACRAASVDVMADRREQKAKAAA